MKISFCFFLFARLSSNLKKIIKNRIATLSFQPGASIGPRALKMNVSVQGIIVKNKMIPIQNERKC